MSLRRIAPFYNYGGSVGFSDDDKSIDFNGTDAGLRTLQEVKNLGFSDEFTIGIWIKPNPVGSGDFFLDMRGKDDPNQNRVFWESWTNPQGLRIEIYNSANALCKRWIEGGVITTGVWQLWTLRFKETGDLKSFFVNGADGGVTLQIDNVCVRNGTCSHISIGQSVLQTADWRGIVHSLAMWDEYLTDAEVLATYNGGDGESFDLQSDSGNYASSANLIRWWRLGLNASDIGKDYVDGDIDLMDDAENITDADIVTDSPT